MSEHNSLGERVDQRERSARIELACLPSMYPNRLRSILAFHPAAEAIGLLRNGNRLHPEVESSGRGVGIDRLRAEVRRSDPFDRAADRSAVVGGHEVVVLGDDRYPEVLANDPEAPVVLFFVGDLALLSRRRVGIVGTRNATAAGRATAVQLGSELAAVGISVVSGLARGIDAAAHRGVREAGASGAVAVVGSGLDQIYPKANRLLWEWVASTGLILSEWPPGSPPEAWHFPLRNRVIAALSEVVVVVESRETGGSLITAEAALQRGIDVLAVPGSRYCRAAAGTNQLISDGAGLVRDIDDVLVALELSHGRSPDEADGVHVGPNPPTQPQLPGFGPTAELSDTARAVLAVCDQRPVTLDQVVDEADLSVIDVARSVIELERACLIRELNGWLESTNSRLRSA